MAKRLVIPNEMVVKKTTGTNESPQDLLSSAQMGDVSRIMNDHY